MKSTRPVSVLMVCLGNICRSPLAEAALRAAAKRKGVAIKVDSAGTGDWHIGHAPDRRAQAVAKRLGGIDIGHFRARQVTRDDFYRFDHILAMDEANFRHLSLMRPADGTAKLSMLLDHLPGHEGTPVPDPYHGSVEAFDAVFRQVTEAAEGILRRLT
ncbi:MAG: low molecular weight phosphotyrosine protein phosphatase [Sphingomonadaceae bacterium]|nr:low molecular weight phosphotyrosine protein phosphatase [Sphingomonadaceae bacterium]